METLGGHSGRGLFRALPLGSLALTSESRECGREVTGGGRKPRSQVCDLQMRAALRTVGARLWPRVGRRPSRSVWSWGRAGSLLGFEDVRHLFHFLASESMPRPNRWKFLEGRFPGRPI